MKYSNKKLNGNEKDDNDCHNSGNLRFNLMDQIRTNCPNKSKKSKKRSKIKAGRKKPLVTRTSPSRASSKIL